MRLSADVLDQVSIEKPNDSHIEELSAFMAKTYIATFGHTYPPEDLESYLKTTYAPAVQLKELHDPTRDTFICLLNQVIVAYVMVHYDYREEGIPGPDPVVELQRFYLDTEWHGTGLSSHLMRHVLSLERVQAAKTVWLGVWESNFKAQAFYRKFGFDKIGQHDFVVGKTKDLDYLYARYQ